MPCQKIIIGQEKGWVASIELLTIRESELKELGIESNPPSEKELLKAYRNKLEDYAGPGDAWELLISANNTVTFKETQLDVVELKKVNT